MWLSEVAAVEGENENNFRTKRLETWRGKANKVVGFELSAGTI